MDHKLKRIFKVKGIGFSMQPTCSCGWVGIAYEASNDWQRMMVREQESEHIRNSNEKIK